MYMMSVISFIVLRKKQPSLERPYIVKNFSLVASLATITVLFFVYLYLPMGPSALVGVEWGMVLVWFVLGIILAALCREKYSAIDDSERDKRLMNT